MDQNLSHVEQRVKRYWYVDGFGELMGGGVFLVLGLAFSVQQYFGDQSLVGVILQSSFALLLIGSMLLARKLIHLLKLRFTYPRTGYVEYQRSHKENIRRRTLAMAVGIVVATASVIIARQFDSLDAMVAMTGLLVAVILLVKQGLSVRMPRFYVLSLASLILGILLSVSGLPRGYNLGAYYGLMGTALAVSGALTLRRYLQQNPLPAEDWHG